MATVMPFTSYYDLKYLQTDFFNIEIGFLVNVNALLTVWATNIESNKYLYLNVARKYAASNTIPWTL